MSSTDFREQIKKKTQVLIQHIIDHHPDTDSNEECGVIDEFEDAIVKLHEAEVERIIGARIEESTHDNDVNNAWIDGYNDRRTDALKRAAITPKGGDQ